MWYDYDYTKIKQKGQYDYEKFFLSSVVLLSLVTSLPVNSPVSAQESISPKAYSHSNGSWFQSKGRWWYKTLKTGETSTRAVPIEDVNTI